jgi:hypothetical protein
MMKNAACAEKAAICSSLIFFIIKSIILKNDFIILLTPIASVSYSILYVTAFYAIPLCCALSFS